MSRYPAVNTGIPNVINKNPANALAQCTYKNTNPFIPPIKRGKVIRVYDGDTIHIASEIWPNQIYRFSIRMRGYDSAEMRTRDKDEKKCAILARDALSEKLMGQIVTLHNVDLEKYGRVLADVYLGKENVNEWMVSNQYGFPYDGGKKQDVDWSSTYNKLAKSAPKNV